MSIKDKLKELIDLKFLSDDGYDVTEKVRDIKSKFHKNQKDLKLAQLSEIEKAIECAPNSEIRKSLEVMAGTIKNQIKESEFKIRVQQEYLQSIVDVQIGRK